MHARLDKIRQLVVEHQFACFVIMCVAIAIVMTLTSLELYRRSGAIKLDMSRPGYEKVRREVEKSQDDQPYPNSGVLDRAAVKDFDARLQKYRQELDKLGDYSGADIDDEDLNLVDGGNNHDSQESTAPADDHN